MRKIPKKYGCPYQGSKNVYARDLFKYFPKADNFYDLFGGGGAMTHYAVTHGYNNVFYNDLDPGVVDYVKRVFNGDIRDSWVSLEEYMNLADTDMFIRLTWGYRGLTKKVYFAGVNHENKYRAYWNYILYNDTTLLQEMNLTIPKRRNDSMLDRRLSLRLTGLFVGPLIRILRCHEIHRDIKEHLNKIKFSNLSYDEVEILPNSVVYCDIPYENTMGYRECFDMNKFIDWCQKQRQDIYISSYQMDDKYFKKIASIANRVRLGQEEKLFKFKK